MFLPKALFLSFPIEYSTNTIASAGAVWTFERSAEGLQGAESVGDGDVWHRRLRFNVTAQFDAIGSSAPHPRLGLADPEKETRAASAHAVSISIGCNQEKKDIYNYR